MANYTYIERLTDAPIIYSALMNGAAGTFQMASTPISIILIAWDDPDEIDWEFARFINRSPYDPTVAYPSIADGIAIGEDDMQLLIQWLPPRRRPHHYGIYWQAASATYDLAANGEKLLPAGAARINGEIPGWATSAIILDPTNVSRVRVVPAVPNTADDSYKIRGNRIISLHAGSVVSAHPTVGIVNLDASSLGHDSNGEFTKIEQTTTVLNTVTDIQYEISPIRLGATALTHLQRVTIDPTLGLDGSPAQFVARTVSGRLQRQGQVKPFSQTLLRLVGQFISFAWTAPGAALQKGSAGAYQLLKWMENGTPIVLTAVQDTGQKPFYRRWVGMIEGISDYAFLEIQDNDEVEIILAVEEMAGTDYKVYWWDLIGAALDDGLYMVDGDTTYDSTNDETDVILRNFNDNGTRAISGDWTALLVDGCRVHVTTIDGILRMELWDRP